MWLGVDTSPSLADWHVLSLLRYDYTCIRVSVWSTYCSKASLFGGLDLKTSRDHTGLTSGTSKLDPSLIDTHCEPEYDVSPPSAPVSLHIQRRLEVLELVASAPGPSRWLHAYTLTSKPTIWWLRFSCGDKCQVYNFWLCQKFCSGLKCELISLLDPLGIN